MNGKATIKKRYERKVSILREKGYSKAEAKKLVGSVGHQKSFKALENIPSVFTEPKPKTQKRIAAENRYNKKVNSLIENGFSEAEARKTVGSVSHQKSFSFIEELIGNKVKTADSFLYVGFADIAGSGIYLEDNEPEVSREQIDERLEECEQRNGNYDKFRGVFKISYGSENDMEHTAYTYYQRSMKYALKHAKFDTKQYHKLTVSNRWSKRDFLNMVNTVLQQCPPDDVKATYQMFLAYDRKNGLYYL